MNTLSKETGSYYHVVMRDQLTDAVFSFAHDASYVTHLASHGSPYRSCGACRKYRSSTNNIILYYLNFKKPF